MTRGCVQLVVVVLLISICTSLRRVTAADDAVSVSDVIRNETEAVKLIVDLTNKSDSRVRPGVYGPPTEVKIDLFVQNFGPLNEMQMEFSLDIDLRQTWADPRLVFNGSAPDVPVYIPYHSIEKFWIPDIYFPNEKSGTMHSITLPNKSIRIYPNGTVRYLTRMAMSLSCTMYLAKFPLDHQICLLKISTYSYDERELVLKWADDEPIELHREELNLPQFDLVGDVGLESCSELYKTGNFSCLAAAFSLRRKVGFFVLQTYIPSMLIVMLSWVGFWINKNSEPARVALGVTTVLTMTTQLTSSASNTMRVSYPKAIDVWYSACMVFVFGALLEFAFVNVFTRSEKKFDGPSPSMRKNDADMESGKKKDAGDGPSSDDEDAAEHSNVDSFCRCIKDSLNADRLVSKWNLTSKKIDRMSRRMFPIAFFLFNIGYWLIYTVIYADRPASPDRSLDGAASE